MYIVEHFIYLLSAGEVQIHRLSIKGLRTAVISLKI